MSAAAVNALSKYTQKCSDCGSSDFVEDFSAGDLVCQVGVMPPHEAELLESTIALLTALSTSAEMWGRSRVPHY